MDLLLYRERTIEGRTIRLIPYSPQYAEQVIRIRNTERARYFLHQDFESTMASQSQWYEGYLSRNNDIYWVIQNRKGQFVGTTALYDIDLANRIGEKGRLNTDEQIAANGPYVLEAELILLHTAFKEIGLERVKTTVREDNVKMQSINEKLGFRYMKMIDIRGVPYYYYELEYADFHPEKFEAILEHWRKRDERTKIEGNFR